MLSWLRRRKTAERIDAEADALIGELGVEAYAEARRREYKSSDDAIAFIAAAKVALLPRTIGLRILDSEGHEVFGRRRGDRSRKHM